MNQKQIEEWELVRQRGKWGFVIRRGVVGWGLLMAVAMTLVDFFRGKLGGDVPGKVADIGLNFIIYPLGGIFFGLVMCSAHERAYQNAVAQQTEGPSSTSVEEHCPQSPKPKQL